MDRRNENLAVLMAVELLVVLALGYLTFVADEIEVMTMVYVVVGLSVVTTPLYFSIFRGDDSL